MLAFACPHCRALIAFHSFECLTCGSKLGYLRELADFVELSADSPPSYRAPREISPDLTWVRCANWEIASCNWLAAEGAPAGLCSCCHLTRTRPADTDEAGMLAFARTEVAKRSLVFQLDTLGLATTPRSADPEHGLAFDLLSSTHRKVITGHDTGVITIDLAEGDDSHREKMRAQLAEPYRTLLGHLRHEIGHWYWESLVDGTDVQERFRDLFGDERRDYAEALAEHYAAPDDRSWSGTCVSHYAASHPWEDWAETFAHYLHMRDTIQTAAAWQVTVGGPRIELNTAPGVPVSAVPQDGIHSFDDFVGTWIPVTLALNALNRSMGHRDLYPFVLSPLVLTKLRFVHDRISPLPRGRVLSDPQSKVLAPS